jgi:hypothetical protein
MKDNKVSRFDLFFARALLRKNDVTNEATMFVERISREHLQL